MWYEKEIQLSNSIAAITGGVILGVIIGMIVGWVYGSFLVSDLLEAACVNVQGNIQLAECRAFAFGFILIMMFAMISGAVEGAIAAYFSGSLKAIAGGVVAVAIVGTFVTGLAGNGEGALHGVLISVSTATIVGLVVWLITWVIKKWFAPGGYLIEVDIAE